ncbi:hypothetical protein, partial [Stappia indica]|uniref:hypothetical protein n=1 Tax=Stappia indica TaxID=538381 RepID=UPI001AD8F2FC
NATTQNIRIVQSGPNRPATSQNPILTKQIHGNANPSLRRAPCGTPTLSLSLAKPVTPFKCLKENQLQTSLWCSAAAHGRREEIDPRHEPP